MAPCPTTAIDDKGRALRWGARVLTFLLLASAAATLAVVSSAIAEPLIERTEDQAFRAAINNAHHEIATCVAFYTISAEGIRRRNSDDPLLLRVEQGRDALLVYMLQLHHGDVTQARIEMEFRSLMTTMRDDFSNFALLLNKHAVPCNSVAEDPRGLVERWPMKEIEREPPRK